MSINKTTLTVEGMSCGHCSKSVTEALQALDGIKTVTVTLDTKQVELEHDAGLDLALARAAIEAIGFDVA